MARAIFLAILIGHLGVTLPALLIIGLFAGIGALVGLIGQWLGSPNCWTAVPVLALVGCVPAWLWWSAAVPRWRAWAEQKGLPPDRLQRWAVLTFLAWPGRLFEHKAGSDTQRGTLNYTLDLAFPSSATAAVLEAIGRLGDPASGHRTTVVLPDGGAVTMPFSSWRGDGKTLPLLPGKKTRLDAYLWVPVEGDVPAGETEEAAGTGGDEPLYLRLWLFMGQSYAKFSFFAPSTAASLYLAEAGPFHAWLGRLLEGHGGLFGLLDVDEKQVYLLPDLDLAVEAPELRSYYDRTFQVFDVDRWVADIRQCVVRPVRPPTVGAARQGRPTAREMAMRTIQGAFGTWREPIPPRFYRTFEEQPFDTCDYCGRPLLEPGTRYIVTKLYAGAEVMHELSMCLGCRDQVARFYSAESRQAMERLFADIDRAYRLEVASDDRRDRLSELTAHCLLCGAARSEVSEHLEYAACEANEILYFVYPYMMCRACTERANDALSAKTKDERQRFWDQHFGLPPPDGLFGQRMEDVRVIDQRW